MEAKRCLECGSKLLGDGRCGPCDLLSWCNQKSSSLVREGLWVEFHPDGEKRSVGAYKKGEPDGLWTYWHGNGQKAVEGAWTEGEPRGVWRHWYPDGAEAMGLTEPAAWKVEDSPSLGTSGEGFVSLAGEKEGRWTYIDSTGRKSSGGEYSAGKKEGLWVYWSEGGRRKTLREYRDGAARVMGRVGPSESSNRYVQYVLEDGRAHGPYVSWHDNGVVACTGTHVEGAKDGEWTHYYESGQLRAHGVYINGVPTGVYTEWYRDGRKKGESTWEGGQAVRSALWREA